MLRLRWALALSALPLFGIITAFGIAPQTVVRDIAVSTVVQDIVLPEQHALSAADDLSTFWQIEQVRKDDTLSTLLSRLNIRNAEAIEFLRLNPDASPLASQLVPGRTILAKTTAGGTLLELQYQIGPFNTLLVKRSNDTYQASQTQTAIETRTHLQAATIQSSLFAATDEAGIPDSVALQLAEIFSSYIDFHLDLRKGDHFSVIYEASYSNGELIKSGNVIAAEFTNAGKIYRAIRYVDADGHANYYTPEGKSLHRAFLRSPLEFSRISSGFSLARFHPVLQKWRAHKGVDYAAPIGTRVKATADGTVAFAGVQNGYGNVVILQHAGGITTVYGHLSRFAAGLRKGQKIAQGDVIGQVGMSGVATGPHLHYEFRVHGDHRDPLKVALPNAPSIPQGQLERFEQHAQPLLAQLALVGGTHTAAID